LFAEDDIGFACVWLTAVDLSKLGDESKYTIDYLGNKDDNTLSITSMS
jgi:hypothetical protein